MATTISKTAAKSEPSAARTDINTATVVGTLSSDPVDRTLASGDLLVSFEITTRVEGEATRSVPVIWTNPKPSWRALTVGDRVLATGQVTRRFFRAGGTTASRTEVVADAVLRDKPAARKRVISRVVDRLNS